MIDDLGAGAGPAARVGVADIALHQVNVARDLLEVFAEAGGKVVEDANASALFEQHPDQVRSDEPGAARHEV